MKVLMQILFVSLLSVGAQAAIPWGMAEEGKAPSLAPMLAEVNPAVVNIATFSTAKQVQNPLLNDPFFRHFFNVPSQPKAPARRQQSAGSGVIVDAQEGVIITNHHVIKDADEIKVILADGRTFTAELVGGDAELDVAVLQIDADDLTQVAMADSDELLVGDFVVAIGNPFGLGQTVTTGIVSALGRSGLGIEGYENFIQTDASINPGNSGGALVNLYGELVGINTAIIAPAGGNVGIGFAIPVNMVRTSMQQILDYGEVKRGQLGVGIQDVDQALREAFDLDNGQQGVLVNQVFTGTAAEKAGLKAGDIITHVNNTQVKSTAQLRSLIAIRAIGEEVRIRYVRDGDEQDVTVKIGEPVNLASSSGSLSLHEKLVGVQFKDASTPGVEVTAIDPSENGAQSGLQVGDQILAVNKQQVFDLEEFKSVLEDAPERLLLQIQRDGRNYYLVIK